jgi:hypothetical protein
MMEVRKAATSQEWDRNVLWQVLSARAMIVMKPMNVSQGYSASLIVAMWLVTRKLMGRIRNALFLVPLVRSASRVAMM